MPSVAGDQLEPIARMAIGSKVRECHLCLSLSLLTLLFVSCNDRSIESSYRAIIWVNYVIKLAAWICARTPTERKLVGRSKIANLIGFKFGLTLERLPIKNS